ncbi:hypothetical protein ACXWO8_09865, partial [Streptococcus pyogenes]
MFEKAFHDKLIPSSMTKELMKEFMELKQGNLSVVEYANKFDDLSRYAHLLVSTPVARVDRFVDGFYS